MTSNSTFTYLLIFIIFGVIVYLITYKYNVTLSPRIESFTKNIKPRFHALKEIKPLSASAPKLSKAVGQYYNFPAQQNTSKPPLICIISLGGSYNVNDLKTYWTANGYSTASFQVPTYQNVDGTKNAPSTGKLSTSDGSIENTLDIEIAMTLCPSAKIKVFFGLNTTLGFYNAIDAARNYLMGFSGMARIISISCGSSELNYAPADLIKYDTLFKLCNTNNIAVCCASGDNAADDGTGFLSVDFPSSSPNVISCGGTSVTSQGESVWSYDPYYKWGGGGGLSYIFKKHTSQLTSDQTFEISAPSLLGTALVNNRSSPDIAMSADPNNGWSIYFNGAYTTVGGTSAVSPAFSAYLGLCNNSTNITSKLYNASTHTNVFRDILLGNIDDLGKGLYYASRGIDQCSGLGSFNGTALLPYIIN